MKNLKDKSWYRLLKVIFIIAFIFLQYIAIISAPTNKTIIKCSNGKEFPIELYDVTEKDIFAPDKACDPNVVLPEIDKNGNFIGISLKEYAANQNWQYDQAIDYKATIVNCFISFITISFLFWIISRIFFYVFAKENFLP